MDALGLKPSNLDQLAELSVGFTRDLLKNRKAQPREKNLARIAEVLDCDVDYLLLKQRAPRIGAMPEDGLPLKGSVEVGAWRDPNQEESDRSYVPFDPDPRFDEAYQVAFDVRDNHAIGYGIGADSTIIAVTADGLLNMATTPARGNMMVISRERGGLKEYSIAKLGDTDPYTAIRKGAKEEVFRHDEFDIEAIILLSVKDFY
jgi:hypothetical protein